VVADVDSQPLAGVLVEIYDKPEGLLMDWKERERTSAPQHRIAACVTGEDGEFCFPRIPAGKYELRFSKPIEWNAVSIYVILAPRDAQSTDSELSVPIGLAHWQRRSWYFPTSLDTNATALLGLGFCFCSSGARIWTF
jgi:hypothetical protein